MTIYRTTGQNGSCPRGGTSTRRKILSLLLTLCALCVLFSSEARLMGQSNAVEGAFDGNIRSTDDALLPGATVVATNVATGVAQTIRSDEAGYFRFPLLHPGTYDLKCRRMGLPP